MKTLSMSKTFSAHQIQSFHHYTMKPSFALLLTITGLGAAAGPVAQLEPGLNTLPTKVFAREDCKQGGDRCLEHKDCCNVCACLYVSNNEAVAANETLLH